MTFSDWFLSSPLIGSTAIGKKLQYDYCVASTLNPIACQIRIYGWGSLL